MSPSKISPLAPKTYVDMPAIDGVRIATGKAGISNLDRTDLMLMVFDEGTEVAGVFTQSKCCAAPVEICRRQLAGGRARAVVVNSGNANAFTGKQGFRAAESTVEAAASLLGCGPGEVFVASTGVIGEPLDASKVTGRLDELLAAASPDEWRAAGKAIMTTDTYPKYATAQADFGGARVTLNGIAKGAGMIAPDMATMLAFIATDAPVDAPVLQELLAEGVERTFNAMTIDGDTSTNDTLLIFATGAAAKRGARRITSRDDSGFGSFKAALDDLLKDLTLQVVRDGEGARKEVTVTVTGAVSDLSAKRIAQSIANSPLVKTAIAGEDSNWGRVVMAVGKAGEPADRDRLAIWFGDFQVAREGGRVPDYAEDAVLSYMKGERITIRADIGLGQGEFTVWTCDLTKDYVAINGEYRS